MPNISRSKNNQTMKLGQLLNYKKRNIFFKSHTENEAEKLVPNLFLFSNMFNMRQKQVVCSLVSMYFDGSQLRIQ